MRFEIYVGRNKPHNKKSPKKRIFRYKHP